MYEKRERLKERGRNLAFDMKDWPMQKKKVPGGADLLQVPAVFFKSSSRAV
jgi:hypothetical protein